MTTGIKDLYQALCVSMRGRAPSSTPRTMGADGDAD